MNQDMELLEHEGLYTFRTAPAMLVKARYKAGHWELSVPVKRPRKRCWRPIGHIDEQGEVWFADETFEHVSFPIAPTFVDLIPREPDAALWESAFAGDGAELEGGCEVSGAVLGWLAPGRR